MTNFLELPDTQTRIGNVGRNRSSMDHMAISEATTKLADDDLLQRMLDGDEDAFAALYRRHQGGV